MLCYWRIFSVSNVSFSPDRQTWRGNYDIPNDKACIHFGSMSATFEFLSRFGDRTADLVSQSGDKHLGSILHSGDVALISLTGLIV